VTDTTDKETNERTNEQTDEETRLRPSVRLLDGVWHIVQTWNICYWKSSHFDWLV